MGKKIFVNLPVRNLEKSLDFFGRLGFSFDEQFRDETAACMVISDGIYVMLLTHDKFKQFTPNENCDAAKQTEVLVCLTCDNRAELDELMRKALDAGGRRHGKPKDYGFMFEDGFQDPDGHIWELIHLTESR